MENKAFRALTSEEKLAHLPSGVFASGEALFYDTRQTTPINETYPDPAGFSSASGIYATYAKNASNPVVSIFGMGGLVSDFSNSVASVAQLINRGITDFSIFNPYIHYYSMEQPTGIAVPYPPTGPVSPTGVPRPVEIEYGFGVRSTGEYQSYPKGVGGTYLRSSREPWNVATSGYDPPIQPSWPPAGSPNSGTGSGVTPP
jgi:hypothetical protein